MIVSCERLADDIAEPHEAHPECAGWPEPGITPTAEQFYGRLVSMDEQDSIEALSRLLSAADFGNDAFLMNWRHDAEAARDIQTNISLITAWIDTSYPVDMSDELRMRRRVDKVMEESGEVIDALNGYWGENPRKGQTNDIDKVEYELLDVACAALGALVSVTGGTSVVYRVQEHLDTVARRMRAAQEERERDMEE